MMVYARPYRVMTEESRTGPDGETLDTYETGSEGKTYGVFAGIRMARETDSGRLLFASGLVRRMKQVISDNERREIRNCYADDCEDSNTSGGGTHPFPLMRPYFAIGMEWDLWP